MIPFRHVRLYWCYECEQHAATIAGTKLRRKAHRTEERHRRQLYRCRACLLVFSEDPAALAKPLRWPAPDPTPIRRDIWHVYQSEIRRGAPKRKTPRATP